MTTPTIHRHEARANCDIQEVMAQRLCSWNVLSTTWTVQHMI